MKKRDMNIANSIHRTGLNMRTRGHNTQSKYTRKVKHKNKDTQ